MLLLFDIDGTLLSGATAAHQQAMCEALLRVHGVRCDLERGPVSPAGRTDPEIARMILLDAGVSAERIDDRAGDVQEECCRLYAQFCIDDLSATVLPGVLELLESLSVLDDMTVALLTGNYEAIARLKLERARIARYFRPGQGAFGSDSEDRTALPALARRRAGESGRPYPRERTIVIGDTPRDIACARADGVRCVAVASGGFAVSELRDADIVVSGASEIFPALLALTPSASGTASA